MITFCIKSICYSMKNSKTISTRGGRPRIFKHEKARAFERDFGYQVPQSTRQNLTDPVYVEIEIYYDNNRKDLDEALVLDLLQKYGVIANDRQVVRKMVSKFIDPANPRVLVKVEPVEWERSGKR